MMINTKIKSIDLANIWQFQKGPSVSFEAHLNLKLTEKDKDEWSNGQHDHSGNGSNTKRTNRNPSRCALYSSVEEKLYKKIKQFGGRYVQHGKVHYTAMHAHTHKNVIK